MRRPYNNLKTYIMEHIKKYEMPHSSYVVTTFNDA